MDKRVKRQLILAAGFAIVFVVLVVATVIINTAMKMELIIQLHAGGWKRLNWVMAVWIGFSLILALWHLAKAFQTGRENVARAEQREQELAAKRQAEREAMYLTTPDRVLNYMRVYRDSCRNQKELNSVQRVIGQLTKMNDLQARLDALLETNEVNQLRPAVNLLQNIEDEICLRRVRRLINYRIAQGDQAFIEAEAQGAEEIDELLSEAQGVLNDIVEFINSDGKDARALMRRIADYRETIQSYLGEEFEDDEAEMARDEYLETGSIGSYRNTDSGATRRMRR